MARLEVPIQGMVVEHRPHMDTITRAEADVKGGALYRMQHVRRQGKKRIGRVVGYERYATDHENLQEELSSLLRIQPDSEWRPVVLLKPESFGFPLAPSAFLPVGRTLSHDLLSPCS